MNKIYRLVWNRTLQAWIPVSEISGGLARGGNKSSRSKLLVASLTLCSAVAQANPSGGVVTAGSGSIDQTANTTTIHQNSQNLSLNWNSFNIGAKEIVNYIQPSASSIAVNRIIDTNATQILGQLNANGQVYLINPNGIVFGEGSQVNVGGLVASTLDINDASLNSNTKTFSGTGTGTITNKGTIVGADGGYIALLANQVSNQGIITAQLGAVALAGGSAVTLTFSDNSLVQVQVSQSTLNNLVENKQLVIANGGQVFMDAGAKASLLASVVNNTGIVEAQTVSTHNGVISLLGGMEAGTVNVAGKLDASAPNGGNGGAIETSAANVKVAEGAQITTVAASGNTGSWLIDPTNFTIASGTGDQTSSSIGATKLSNSLNTSDVTITTSATANGSDLGDINVNAPFSWSAHNLTLSAYNNININSAMNATGTAGLALKYGQGATDGKFNNVAATANINAPINLATTSSFSTQLGSTGSVVNYSIVDSLGAAADASTAPSPPSLQGMAATANLSTNFVLGSNINATETATWNANAGFTPIGNFTNSFHPFTGLFNGLGHTINNLSINRPSTDYVGLLGYVSSTAVISNLGLVGDQITGLDKVGGLVGYSSGSISNSYATGSVTGQNYVGGLVGRTYSSSSTISNSYATAAVTGSYYVGGLVGDNDYGVITNNYATGTVFGDFRLGGLVGHAYYGTITNNYATGAVRTTTEVGGLVGYSYGTNISNNFYNKTTTGQTNGIGSYNPGDHGTLSNLVGLETTDMQKSSSFTGWNFTTTPGQTNKWVIVNADGSLNANGTPGGGTMPMLASEYSTTITNAHQLQLMAMDLNANYTLGANIDATATGNTTNVWGSAGFAPIGSYSNQFTGSFNGLGYTINNLSINRPSTDIVGLFGLTSPSAAISNVGLAGGSIQGADVVGGLVAFNFGTINNSHATGIVTGNNYVGGLVGANLGGTINNSYATGNVNGSSFIGGLIGLSKGNGGGNDPAVTDATISSSYAMGNVTATNKNAGGLVGVNSGGDGVCGNCYNDGYEGLKGSSATITNSYSKGNVTGTVNVGGLVGLNTGGVGGDVDRGELDGGNGGLNGGDGGLASIINSYSISAVSATGSKGALVGLNTIGDAGKFIGYHATVKIVGAGGNATVANSFYDSIVNGSLKGIAGVDDVVGKVRGMSTTAMKLVANFVGPTTANGLSSPASPGWDFSTPSNEVWNISSGTNGGYPFLCSIVGGCVAQTAAAPTPPAPTPPAPPPSIGAGTTTTLSGLSGYTPVISGGTLVLNKGDSASTALTIASAGGTIQNPSSGSATLSGALSGSGGLTFTGTGTTVLTGNNTYTGGTTVASGTLQGNTSSLQGNVINNGTVVFDQATTGTFTGTITGTGKVVTQNTGTVVLTGNNTYTGGTTVNAGSNLSISSGSALGTGSLDLRSSSTNTAALSVTADTIITNTIILSGD